MQKKSDKEKKAKVKTSEVEVADYKKPLNEYEDYLSVSSGLPIIHRAHICQKYHKLYLWRKICHSEKFQISVKNLNNLWTFIEIYTVFVLNSCGENLCWEKMTNMRSDHTHSLMLSRR